MSDRDLFFTALDVPQTERVPFLLQKAEDEAQRLRVEELLDAHLAAGGFLADQSRSPSRPTDLPNSEAANLDRDQPGQLIAQRYRLLEQIGEGGMGTVWKAEQLEPVRRLVAIKLIKPGMDSKQVIARFDAERQALALMDHPHIARIHDGGAMADGRPFFVMELVAGIPLTRYCDERKLTISSRLQLFTQICQAVQHAHQKGILHRDLKPGNLLVAEHDGQPIVKVIDFGLAKAIQPSMMLTDQTLNTSAGTVVGTPLYMAPEQVERNALDIDTRADIYALGVVLYELLTGTTPLERERFRTAAWDEIKRLIREEEPPKPSTRLSSTEGLPSIASQRDTEPAKLGRFLRGDLDWIVMKTLEKDRDRRYASAIALAEDVNRFLNHEPVSAGPPSATYKMQKFVRRHRSAVLAGSAMLLLLISGMIGTTWGMLAAQQQRDRAMLAEQDVRQQRDRAVQAEKEVRQQKDMVDKTSSIITAVNHFLLNDLLGQAHMSNQPKEAGERNPDIKVRTLVDRAAATIEGKFAATPNTEMAIRTTLGEVYIAMGLYPEAEKQLQRVVELTERHLEPDHQTRVQARTNLAYLRERQGHYEEAAGLRAKSAEKGARDKGADHPDTLLERLQDARLMNIQGKAVEAEKVVREVLTHVQKLPPQLVAMAQHELAASLGIQARDQEAEPLYRAALAIRVKELGPDHHDVLSNQQNLALNLILLNKLEEAESLLRAVVVYYDSKLGADHPETLTARGNYAMVLNRLGKHDEAIALHREVLQQKIKKYGADHPATLGTRYNLGNALYKQQKVEQAEALLAENLGYCVIKLGPTQVNTLMTKMKLAHIYMDLKKYALAEPLFRDCLVARDKHQSISADPIVLEFNLGLMLYRQNKFAEAEPVLVSVFQKITPESRKAYLEQKPVIANLLATISEKTGKKEDAARWRKEVKDWTPQRPPVK